MKNLTEDPTVTQPQSIVAVHKITQAERSEYLTRYNQLIAQNPTLAEAADGVKGFTFHTAQLIEDLKANPNGGIFLEIGGSVERKAVPLINIYSETGELVGTYEGGIPCPPFCPRDL